MIRNYFLVAFRNLLRNKSTSLVKIISLSVGMIGFAIITLYIFHETSFDKFHEQPDRVRRVVKDFVNEGSRLPDATTPPALAPAIQRDLPEVEYATRVFPNWGGKYLLQHGDDKRIEEKLFRIDSSFFDVFTFPFIAGDKKTSLTGSNFILLTQSSARKYFGDDDPIGKTIKIDLGPNGTDLTVTGVLKDIPENSHFTFDFLISVRTFNEIDTNWGWYNYYTYVRLKEGVDPVAFDQKLQPLFKRYRPNDLNEYYSQALTDIHLKSNLKWELGNNGDQSYIFILATIAMFIIVLAAINYINLVIAQSVKRAKEVGVRKVAGANRSLLLRQFLFESVLLACVALVLSLAIAESILPGIANTLGVSLSFFDSQNIIVVYALIGVTILTGLLAGVYPALYLSSFQPAKVLKAAMSGGGGRGLIRKGLVTFQFIISTVLICGTLVISQQLNFIRNTDLGFDTDNIIVIPGIRNANGHEKKTALVTEFKKIAGVIDAGAADGVLGGQNWTNGIRAKDGENTVLLNFLSLDHDFLRVMDIELQDGRFFSPQSVSDSSAIILNETAVKLLGIKEPVIGSQIVWDEDEDGTLYFADVVGVIKDFHFTSFHEPIKPFGFTLNENNANTIFLKVSANGMDNTIDKLKTAWQQIENERPFEFSFQDERVAKLYEADARLQILLTWFTVIAIIIASLGLFGLSAYAAQQRIKEIGIRKVLGASVPAIIRLLSLDFLKVVSIAIVIALPVALYCVNKWLSNFAYKIEPGWTVFAVAAFLALAIALVTVSSQAIKAAISNPVDSLRSE